jgi:hypothetical protein
MCGRILAFIRRNTTLGKFFATGIAARRLADGFAGALSEAKCKTADGAQTPPPATNP